MSQQVESGCKTFTAGAAIAEFLRVKLSSAVLAAADAGDQDLGVIQAASFASGDVRSVRLASAEGTAKMTASAAISSEAVVYGAAGGKISSTENGNIVGIALEAATADDDIIEVARIPPTLAVVAAITPAGSDQTDGTAITAKVNIVTGADGTKAVVLPTAVIGEMIYIKTITAAQTLEVFPAVGGAINALGANTVLSMGAVTSCLLIASSSTQWYTWPLLPS